MADQDSTPISVSVSEPKPKQEPLPEPATVPHPATIKVEVASIPKSKDPNYIRNPTNKSYIKRGGSAHKALMAQHILDADGKKIEKADTEPAPVSKKASKTKVKSKSEVEAQDEDDSSTEEDEPVVKSKGKSKGILIKVSSDSEVDDPNEDETKDAIRAAVRAVVNTHKATIAKMTEDESDAFIHGMVLATLSKR